MLICSVIFCRYFILFALFMTDMSPYSFTHCMFYPSIHFPPLIQVRVTMRPPSQSRPPALLGNPEANSDMQSLVHVLGLPSGRPPSLTCPGGVQVRCPDHLCWFLSLQRCSHVSPNRTHFAIHGWVWAKPLLPEASDGFPELRLTKSSLILNGLAKLIPHMRLCFHDHRGCSHFGLPIPVSRFKTLLG